MRAWLVLMVVCVVINVFGLATESSIRWKTLRADDLCFQVPEDWYDFTSIARLFFSPDLLRGTIIEGITISALFVHLPLSLEEEMAIFAIFYIDERHFSEFLASKDAGAYEVIRTEGLVAGEPGVYEEQKITAPFKGSGWVAYTSRPRADDRHVVLLALLPKDSEVPAEVIQQMLFSVTPCPYEPSSPCALCEAKLVELQQQFKALLNRYEVEVKTLQKKVTELEETIFELRQTRGLRIGVVDTETLFTSVFLPQVAKERSALQAKGQALQDLQTKYAQGQIKADAYQQQYAKLQAEYLQAQVNVNMSMLEKMIASPGFANLRADLQNLRDLAKPLADEVADLVKQAQVTILDYTTFFNRLQQLQNAFQHVDQLLTQVAAAKILEITQQVAQEQGYDIVLRTKDVVMYKRVPTITDLTSEVEKRLWQIFPPK